MRTLTPPERWAMRVLGGLLSGNASRASLVILIYHRVLREPDLLLPSEPSAAEFEAQMDLVAELFTVLPLREAVKRLRSGTLPRRALSITFDDGYANNLHVAQPILARRGLPATIFVAPGFLEGGRMFNDTVIEAIRRSPPEIDLSPVGLGMLQLSDVATRRAAVDTIIGKLKYLAEDQRRDVADRIAEIAGDRLSTNLMLTPAEVLEAHREGMEVGAHTVNHPILLRADPSVARREIVQSKHRLEEIIGEPVRSFAYPNGRPQRDYDAQHVSMARDAGFEQAVSTAWGAASAGSDMMQLPRIAPWDRKATRFAARILRSYRDRKFDTA